MLQLRHLVHNQSGTYGKHIARVYTHTCMHIHMQTHNVMQCTCGCAWPHGMVHYFRKWRSSHSAPPCNQGSTGSWWMYCKGNWGVCTYSSTRACMHNNTIKLHWSYETVCRSAQYVCVLVSMCAHVHKLIPWHAPPVSTAVLFAALTHWGEEVDGNRAGVLLKVLQIHNPKMNYVLPGHRSSYRTSRSTVQY